MKRKTILLAAVIFCINLTTQSQTKDFITLFDFDNVRITAQAAEMEGDMALEESTAIISLPLPNGEFREFRVLESPVLGDKLSRQYPNIKSFLIEGVRDKSYHGRLSISSTKLTAVFYSPAGSVYLEPVDSESQNYRSYYGDINETSFECGVKETSLKEKKNTGSQRMSLFSNGATLRDYDMIIATTGEFYQANGNTDAAVTAEVNSIMTAINVLYENEASIRFTTVSINLLSDPATDGLDPAGNRTFDANNVINNYANANSISFDIGHVLHTGGGGGIAGTGPCTTNNKARGWSGVFSGASIFSWVSLLGHEIGHQFSASHSFYGTESNCGPNRSVGNGYEPGSGNTIMSYSGLCGTQNITPTRVTNYFHENSLTQIVNYANTHTCPTNTSSGNNIPSVSMPSAMTIPVNTPFYLKGGGTDGDGDLLTYCWEQHDTDNISHALGAIAGIPANAATSTTAPLFRSFDPSSNGFERYFPQLSDVVSGTTTQGEVLSTIGRTINMRLTVRDNVTGGGAFEYDDVAITVDGNGSAFSVSAPNGGETLTAGSNATVTWNQASTASYCSNVDILLSVDGGFNYPYTLATSVSNNGTASVNVPAGVPNSSIARIMVRCANDPDAYFFDVSDSDFNINSSCLAPSHLFTNVSPLQYNQGQTADLDVTASYLGITVTGFTGTSFSFGQMAVIGQGGSGCTSKNFNHESFEFTVDVTGTYSISQNPNFCGFSVFSGSSTACTNFLGSTLTSTGGGNSVTGSPVSVTLTAGSIYTLAITNIFASTTVAFGGPGNVLEIGNLPVNYIQSYLAIDQSTGLVADVDAGADFTGLAVGKYDVYGFTYENDGANAIAPPDVNPNTFIGQSIAAILSGGDCVTFSNNRETLEIFTAGGCGITSLNLASVSCNDNGTPFTSSDDNITFTLNPTGIGVSTNYNINVSSGTVTPSTGTYGSSTAFQLQNGSAGAGDVSITLTDGSDASCTSTEVLSDPGTCTNCLAEGYDFSPTSSISANQGSSTLDLGLSPNYLNILTDFVGTLSTSSSSSNLSFDNGNGACQGPSNSNFYDVYEFSVDLNGDYTFEIDEGDFGIVMNIYDDVYNTSNVCNNWIGSSGTLNGGSVSLGSQVTVSLTTGINYNIVISTFNQTTFPSLPADFVITGTGPGNIFDTNPPPGPYDYTYVVVNTANNTIAGFQADSDLSNYAAGSYEVYGLSYYDMVNLNSYLGSSFTTFQNDLAAVVVCGDLSTNSIDVTINAGNNCPPSYTLTGNENGTGGQNNNGDFETDGVITSSQNITGGTVYYDSGTDINLNASFEVILGAEFNAVIDGCGGTFIITSDDGNSTLLRKSDTTKDTYK